MSKEFKKRKDEKKKPLHSLKERRALKHEKKLQKTTEHNLGTWMPQEEIQ